MFGALFEFFRQVFFFAAYVNSGGSFPEPLSPQEEKDCLAKYAKGDQSAWETLIVHNLRLVAHIAKKYAVNGRSMDDVISIGTIGLIKGVSTYKQNKGTALATYAARCIENEILMSLRCEKRQAPEISIFDAVGKDKDGNDITFSEILGCDPSSVADEVELRLATQTLYALMDAHLSEREKRVIELRYGVAGHACMAQREIANVMDISRSYVSRIEKKRSGNSMMRLGRRRFAKERLPCAHGRLTGRMKAANSTCNLRLFVVV